MPRPIYNLLYSQHSSMSKTSLPNQTFGEVRPGSMHPMSGEAPMLQNRITFVLVLIFGALSRPCAGQEAPAPSKVLAIQHIAAKIVVDGWLDEPVWQTIHPVTDFTQTSPDLGKPISERTEALIFYDDENLYVGFRCYDSEPKKIVRRLVAGSFVMERIDEQAD